MILLFALFLVLDKLSNLRLFREEESLQQGVGLDKVLVTWLMKLIGPSLNWLLRFMPLFFTP